MNWLRYVPPNLVTLVSLTAGVLSIRFAASGDVVEASWFILYAVLLDQLDGTLARVLNARSRMGVELDSFADLVGFGIAPAFLILGPADAGGGLAPLGLEHALACVYIYGCTLRLARYNALDSEDSPEQFRGLPSTLAGSLVAATVLAANAHGVDLSALGLEWLLAALGFLMLAPIGPPKMNVLLARGASRGGFWLVVTVANVLAVYVFVIARVLPEYLLALGLAYASIGTLMGMRRSTVTSD